jgi:N-acyl-D-amino-acid deacylase
VAILASMLMLPFYNYFYGNHDAIREMLTHPAGVVGLSDGGVIEVGKRADVSVIDMNALTLHPARMAYDLPAGGQRVVDDASGYTATIVSGVVTRRGVVDTGARPGRLVRGAR